MQGYRTLVPDESESEVDVLVCLVSVLSCSYNGKIWDKQMRPVFKIHIKTQTDNVADQAVCRIQKDFFYRIRIRRCYYEAGSDFTGKS